MKCIGAQFKGELDRSLPYTLICTLFSSAQLGHCDCRANSLETTPAPPILEPTLGAVHLLSH
jgi:hypothetical protein